MRSDLTAYVSVALPTLRDGTRIVRAITMTTAPPYRLHAAVRRVKADGDGDSGPERAGVDRQPGRIDAANLAV